MAKFRRKLVEEIQKISPNGNIFCCVTLLGLEDTSSNPGQFIQIDPRIVKKLYNVYILNYVSNYELSKNPDVIRRIIDYVLTKGFIPKKYDSTSSNLKFEAHHILPLRRWDPHQDSMRMPDPSDSAKNGILIERQNHRLIHRLSRLLELLGIRPFDILTEFFADYPISLYLTFTENPRITMVEVLLIVLAHKNYELWVLEKNYGKLPKKLEDTLITKGLLAPTSIQAILNRRIKQHKAPDTMFAQTHGGQLLVPSFGSTNTTSTA